MRRAAMATIATTAIIHIQLESILDAVDLEAGNWLAGRGCIVTFITSLAAVVMIILVLPMWVLL